MVQGFVHMHHQQKSADVDVAIRQMCHCTTTFTGKVCDRNSDEHLWIAGQRTFGVVTRRCTTGMRGRAVTYTCA